MGEDGRREHGIWQRAAGLGALALFCATFLLALGLVELVFLSVVVLVVGALASGVGWLVIRHRGALVEAIVNGYRNLSRVGPPLARATGLLLTRSLAVAARGGRAAVAAGEQRLTAVARQVRPAAARARAGVHVLGVHTGERTRAGIASATPVVKRAQQEAIAQVRAVGSAGGRQAARAAALVAADLAAYRQRALDQNRRRRQLPPASASVGWSAEPSAGGPARDGMSEQAIEQADPQARSVSIGSSR